MTREDAQKVANAMNMTVYHTTTGWFTNAAGMTILETVEPTVNTKTVPNGHGLGEKEAMEYATPRGDGTKL